MNVFSYLEKIPDYLYPIPERVGGRTLYFKKAYDHRLNVCVQKFGGMDGAQRHCTRLIIWRELCHVFGSILFIAILHFVVLPKSLLAVEIASVLFVLYFIWQEYVFQPKIERLRQILFKANLDIAAWCVPVIFYWLFAYFF